MEKNRMVGLAGAALLAGAVGLAAPAQGVSVDAATTAKTQQPQPAPKSLTPADAQAAVKTAPQF
ncbi:hypothetical protein, partial [Lacticaseibacillus camelliae]|uniref:hypothetical protein n=1 Tax=Lacticaseibacillus camelliae TaxID=381742 RepID=UPI0006D08FCA